MPSKKNIEAMRLELHKMLIKDPEIKNEFKREIVADRLECATVIAVDYMTRYMDATPEQIDKFLDHIILQFQCIGVDDWTDYFEDMDNTLAEETGIRIMGFIKEKL